MRNGVVWAAAAFGSVAAFGAFASRRAVAAEKPDAAAVAAARQALVGEWKLNAQLSDDARAKMREGRPEGGGGGAGGGGGRGGWGGGGMGHGGGGMGHGGGGGWGGGHGGGMGHGGGGEAGGQGEQAAARSMMFRANQITVTNLTPELTILGPEGEIRRLHADDKSYKEDETTEVKARWDDAKLVVETKTERGRVKETWAVANDPRRLTVLMEVDRPWGGTAKIKRVYDAAAAGAPAGQPDAPKAAPDATKPASGSPNPGPPNPGPPNPGPPNPGR